MLGDTVSGEFEVSELESIIENAWQGVGTDYRKTIWYTEAEIVASFYHHLRSNGRFRKISEKYQLVPILEYCPKKRFDAIVKEPPYPQPQPEKRYVLDFVIIRFLEKPQIYTDDFDKWRFAYWGIKHRPIIAMEFKYPPYEVKKDFDKLAEFNEVYGTERCYFCFIAEKLPKLPELVRENEERFRVAYGLRKENKWQTVSLAEYRASLNKGKGP